jgi:hypothetical protein
MQKPISLSHLPLLVNDVKSNGETKMWQVRFNFNALSRLTSRREHTSFGRLQLSSHICVLKINLLTCRTLKGVRTYCWDVQTYATWSSSKLLDIEEGPDEKFSSFGRIMIWQLSVRTDAWNLIALICTKSSKSITLNKKTLKVTESLLKNIITYNWFCPA